MPLLASCYYGHCVHVRCDAVQLCDLLFRFPKRVSVHTLSRGGNENRLGPPGLVCAQPMEEFQCFLGVFPLQLQIRTVEDAAFFFYEQMDVRLFFFFFKEISPTALLITCHKHTKESQPVRPEQTDKLGPVCPPKPVRDDTWEEGGAEGGPPRDLLLIRLSGCC